MTSSSSPFIRLLDEEGSDEHDMSLLSTPSKVAFSTAQNPLRSTTPGYRETDIQLLAMEAGRPRLERSLSEDSERQVSTVPDAMERKRELYRQIAASYSALTLYFPRAKKEMTGNRGLNDGAPGALLPSLEAYYDLNYAVISFIFLANAAGFIAASFLSNKLHVMVGRCKSLIIGTALQASCYVILSTHPPYGAVVVGFFLAGAEIDGEATRPSAVKVLGYMHSCYGLGAALAPIIATVVSRSSLWSNYYFIPLGLTLLSLVAVGLSFRNEHSADPSSVGESRRNAQRGKLGVAVRNKITWIAATFIFLYQGAEVALGGWLVTFMIQVRQGDPSTMGYTATGFWLGITVGRMLMGHTPTGKLGQKRIVYIYLILTLVLYLLFWLIPSIVASSVAIALVGICLGPIYPCTMNVLSKLIDDRGLLVAVVGVVGALGNAGGAIAPFTTGLLAQSKGVWVLQPVILTLVASMIVTWWFLPNIPSRSA